MMLRDVINIALENGEILFLSDVINVGYILQLFPRRYFYHCDRRLLLIILQNVILDFVKMHNSRLDSTVLQV